jgi:hypothetical protein
MRYLCGRPSKLEHDDKRGKIKELRSEAGVRAADASQEDEGEGAYHAHSTDYVPTLALSIPIDCKGLSVSDSIIICHADSGRPKQELLLLSAKTEYSALFLQLVVCS